MTPTEKLVSLFDSRAFRTPSELGWKRGRWPRGREEAMAELQEAGRLVKWGARYYLDASLEREAERLEALARGSVQLLTERALLGGGGRGGQVPPFFREALERLVDERRLLRWEVAGQAGLGFVYLHCDALPGGGEGAVPQGGGAAGARQEEGVEERIIAAYRAVSARDQSATIWISDLVAQSGLPLATVHGWIRRRVIGEGWGTLDEADYPAVGEIQRAASIEYNGRQRLYIRLHL